MDWIDPRYSEADDLSDPSQGKSKDKGKKRNKPFSAQVAAALAQPLEVWSAAFGHGLLRLKWPAGCSLESTFLWSTVIEEQAKVLGIAGLPSEKLAELFGDSEVRDARSEPADTPFQLTATGTTESPALETLAYQWLDSADSSPSAALGIIALAWQIAEHAQSPNSHWLTQWLQDIVDRIAKYQPDEDDAVLCHLTLQCELPMLICMTTAGTKRVVQTEASRCMDNLALLLEKGEDHPYPWLVHGATYLRAALASVLRCRVLADGLGLRKLYPPQQKALAVILQHAARWSRSDGTSLLGATQSIKGSHSIWNALVKQTRAPKSLLFSLDCAGIKLKKYREAQKKSNLLSLLQGSHYCESAGCVTMRSDWRQKGSRFAMDFSDNEIFIEALGPKGQSVLAGEWGLHVASDTQSEMQLGEWEEVCWFTDDEVDYLEVEVKVGPHSKVQRQAILLREERLLVLADALLSTQPGNWKLKSTLPLAPGVQFHPAEKTREGFLELAGSQRCLALPLHLPEWRRQLADGKFEAHQRELHVTSESASGRAYSAVVMSLCNRHSKKPFTWRHLTVAEQLQIVPKDVAAAYRIQIGKEQWLIYRTLAAAARRTALGMHTFADFYCGRFTESGDLETLVEVDAAV
jgi:hypothetical protein